MHIVLLDGNGEIYCLHNIMLLLEVVANDVMVVWLIDRGIPSGLPAGCERAPDLHAI